MAKRIAVAKVEPIILEFPDGTTKVIMLNNMALMILNEEFGDIQELFEDVNEKPFEIISKLIYAGIKATEPNFTLEEAEVIALNGGIELLAELTEHLVKVFDNNCEDENLKKKLFQEIQDKIPQ